MKSFVFDFFNQIYWQYFSRNKIKYRETDGRMEIKTCNHIYKHFPALESGELKRYILGWGGVPHDHRVVILRGHLTQRTSSPQSSTNEWVVFLQRKMTPGQYTLRVTFRCYTSYPVAFNDHMGSYIC